MSIYKEQGFESREDYLLGLAEDYGVPYSKVWFMAYIFGPSEDFDGLVSAVRDYADGYSQF